MKKNNIQEKFNIVFRNMQHSNIPDAAKMLKQIWQFAFEDIKNDQVRSNANAPARQPQHPRTPATASLHASHSFPPHAHTHTRSQLKLQAPKAPHALPDSRNPQITYYHRDAIRPLTDRKRMGRRNFKGPVIHKPAGQARPLSRSPEKT